MTTRDAGVVRFEPTSGSWAAVTAYGGGLLAVGVVAVVGGGGGLAFGLVALFTGLIVTGASALTAPLPGRRLGLELGDERLIFRTGLGRFEAPWASVSEIGVVEVSATETGVRVPHLALRLSDRSAVVRSRRLRVSQAIMASRHPGWDVALPITGYGVAPEEIERAAVGRWRAADRAAETAWRPGTRPA